MQRGIAPSFQRQMKITLPSAQLIAPNELADLIADALQPSRRTRRGMACIAWKRAAVALLDPANEGQLTDTFFNFKLSKVDYELIESQLHQLPFLHGGMSDAEQVNFLHQFKRRNPDVSWTPVLEVGEDSEQERKDREAFRASHLNAIRDAIVAGKILAVSGDRTPARHIGALLPLAQARQYAQLCGIDADANIASTTEPRSSSSGKSERRDEFDDALDEAIKTSGESHEVRKVWPKLVEMALAGRFGLSYEPEDAISARNPKSSKHTVSVSENECIRQVTRDAVYRRLLGRRGTV